MTSCPGPGQDRRADVTRGLELLPERVPLVELPLSDLSPAFQDCHCFSLGTGSASLVMQKDLKDKLIHWIR
jgi:hypothetical protein